MWQKLKKVDWTGGPLDLIAVALLIVGVAIWSVRSGEAEAKIQEFNTITHTWNEVQH